MLSKKELKETLQYNQEEVIFMPNEIFEDLKKAITTQCSKHIAFAYSYYFLVMYLYRYAKHGSNDFKKTLLKQLLGYAPKSMAVDFIVKKNGLLNQLGYTEVSSDFPIQWHFTKSDSVAFLHGMEADFLEFTMYSELEDRKNMRNRKIDVPVKGLYRTKESECDDYLDGTFYDQKNTHKIGIEEFIHCMSNEELGVEGFYLYSLIKHKNNLFQGFWNISQEKLVGLSGLGRDKCKNVLQALRQYRMIEATVVPWVKDRPEYAKTKSNGYRVNHPSVFVTEKVEIKKRKVINWETCKAEHPQVIVNGGGDFDIDAYIKAKMEEDEDLPF